MIEIEAISSSSKGNCYRVTDGKTPLLLECGITFKEMQRAFDFDMSFAGCLITHEHGDHCKAIKMFCVQESIVICLLGRHKLLEWKIITESIL